MSMLEIHADALARVDEATHLFLLRYKHDEKMVFGIVEGRDDPMFYRSTIERFIPDDWNVDLIRGGNKQKVLQTYSQFDWNRFDKTRVVFFIDRDVDEFCGLMPLIGENIYVTDGYSIENAVVNRDLFIRIMVEVFNLGDLTRKESDAMKASFNEDLVKFQDALVPIMAQIIAWRSDKVRANLNDIDLGSFFEFRDGRLHLVAEFEDYMERVARAAKSVGAEAADKARIDEIVRLFVSKSGPARFTRGKYLIWFLSRLCSHVHSSVGNITNTYRSSPKLRITVGQNNIMVVAAPRARCPLSLRKFIERTFVRYIERLAISPG